MPPKRLYVVGNCHALTYHRALKQLLPDWDVTGFAAVRTNRDQWKGKCAQIRDADVVFYLPEITAFPEFHDLVDNTKGKETVRVSVLKSYRYHPDMTILLRNGAEAKVSAFPFHSNTVLMGYKRKRSVRDVVSVLSDPSQTIFGEIAQDDRAQQESLSKFADAGIDLKSALPRWSRRGPFMHVPNHPCAKPLMDIAVQVVRQQGWADVKHPPEPEFSDPLNGVNSPLYAGLARALGIKEQSYARDGLGNDYTLHQWVQQYYDAYEKAEQGGWLHDLIPQRDLEHLLDDVI